MAKRKSVSFAELAEAELRTPPVQRTYSKKKAATTSKKKRASQKTLTQIDFIKRQSPIEDLDLELQYELPPSAQKEPPSKRVKREPQTDLTTAAPLSILKSPRRPQSESRLAKFLSKTPITLTSSQLRSPIKAIQSSQADEVVSPIFLRTPTRKLRTEVASSQSPEATQLSPLRRKDSPSKRSPLAPLSTNLKQSSASSVQIMEEKPKLDRPLFRKPMIAQNEATIDLTLEASQDQAPEKSTRKRKTKVKRAATNDQSKLSLTTPTETFIRPKRVKVLQPGDEPVEAEAEFETHRKFTESFDARNDADANVQKRGRIVLDSAQTSFEEPNEIDDGPEQNRETSPVLDKDGAVDDIPPPDTESFFPDLRYVRQSRAEPESLHMTAFPDTPDLETQNKPKRESNKSTFKTTLAKVRTTEELFDEHATPLGRPNRPTQRETVVPPPSSPELPASSSAFWNAETCDDETEAMLPISHDTLHLLSDQDGNLNVVIPSSIPELSESQILPASLIDFTIRRPPVLEQQNSNTWNMSTQE